MLDFLYQSGWGAFAMMLFLQIPFLIVFFFVVYRKAYRDSAPSDTDARRFSRVEGLWMTIVVVLFVVINVVSISYMPTVATAQAATTDQDLQEIEVTAQSWAYQISDRNLEVGRPVRFSVTSADTVHGFAVYDPDGRLLFTQMLIPGMAPSSLIYTFSEPGTYTVRCLEYCGIAHHAMRDHLTVTRSD